MHTFARTLSAIACAAALLTAPVITGAHGAQAAARSLAVALRDYDNCPNEYLCIYANANGDESNGWGAFQKGVNDLSSWNGGSLGYKVGSVYNRSSDSWCLYDQPKHKGAAQVISPGGKVNLTDHGVDSLQRRGWSGC
ncbi:peptidase inhibitor family I36 protein [Streptomyces noursei]|uniref:peptidase inhibitor family I36 protein n=1 Tax=Streptomyces noursei TaxID=1971 RepID=UPI0030F12E5B